MSREANHDLCRIIVGMHALPAELLSEPCNGLEREEDPDGVWRYHVNENLGHQYVELFSFIDKLIMLAAPDFSVVTRWRLEQEQSLRAKVAASAATATRLMEIAEVERFVQLFERWTRYMLDEMPSRADLLMQLDADRNVIKVTP